MARILVVDDNPQVARLVEFKLEREGYEVQVVHDGSTAIDTATESPPDLCILDVMMPGLSGYEVLIEFRKNPDLAKLPVILLTSLGEERHVVKGLQSGADDYMVKPFSPSELLARVNRLLAA